MEESPGVRHSSLLITYQEKNKKNLGSQKKIKENKETPLLFVCNVLK